MSKLGLEVESLHPRGRKTTPKEQVDASMRVHLTTMDHGMRPPWVYLLHTSKNLPRVFSTAGCFDRLEGLPMPGGDV